MDQVQQAQTKVKDLFGAYQFYLDKSVPLVKERWAALAVVIVIFLLRVVVGQGWYIVCYGLFIYLLNLFLAFLTPKFDPSVEDDLRSTDAEEGALPSSEGDEFKPFMRRLPEFQFWHRAAQATVLSLFLTVSRYFDIPVFWPILVLYFIVLFALTMRRQIQHMIKYRYLPFDIGKKRFAK